MDRFVNTTFRWWWNLIIQLALLTVGFLSACSYTFGTKIISIILWPAVGMSGIAFLYRFVHLKMYAKSKLIWLMAAFICSFGISTLLNYRYGWYSNVVSLVWTGILFFVFYCYRSDESANGKIKNFTVLSVFYIFITSILCIASFIVWIKGLNIYYIPETGPRYYIGFFWGRLYGVFWDPNIGAVMCVIGAVLACGLIPRYKAFLLRFLLSISIVLDYLFILFSGSRAGKLAFCVGVSMLCLLLLLKRQRWYLAVIVAFFAVILVYFSFSGAKTLYNSLVTYIDIVEEEKQETKHEVKQEENGKGNENKEDLLRRNDNVSDISNRRFDIWKAGLQILKKNPIFGIGHANVVNYVKENIPDSYLINNDYMVFSSMHNGYLDVLLSQGIVGFGIYIAMALKALIILIKNWKEIELRMGGIAEVQFTLLFVLMGTCLVISEVLFVTSPMSTMFWISLGALMSATNSKKGKEEIKE